MDDDYILKTIQGAVAELALALGSQWRRLSGEITALLARAVAGDPKEKRRAVDRMIELLLASPGAAIIREISHEREQGAVRSQSGFESVDVTPPTQSDAAASLERAIKVMGDPHTSLEALRTVTPQRPARPAPTSDAGPADSAVFAPAAAALGDQVLVQVFVYPPEEEIAVGTRAMEADTDAKRRAIQTLAIDLTPATRLDIRLELPGLCVGEPDATLTWRGRANMAQFCVDVPTELQPRKLVGTVRVAVAGVPVGMLRFRMDITRDATPRATPREASVRRYRKVFMSYSSHDRAEVLKRAQAFKLTGVEFFQDILNLEPGDRWERELYRNIDDCDAFFLFWSSYSKASEWVDREIDYVLARKDGNEDKPPAIVPIPVETPIPSPPPKLNHLHFNDALLAHIQLAEHEDS